VTYGSSDEEDAMEKREVPRDQEDGTEPSQESVLGKRSVLSSLPAPKKLSRKQQRLLLKEKMRRGWGDEDEDEEEAPNIVKNGPQHPSEEVVSEETPLEKKCSDEAPPDESVPSSAVEKPLPILQMGEAPGPAAPPAELLSQELPDILFEGKRVIPPPGLRPPPSLGRGLGALPQQLLPTDPLVSSSTAPMLLVDGILSVCQRNARGSLR
jgi:hypothetical protein